MKKLFLFFLSINTAFSQIDPSKIQIARDKWGVPHIFAKTDAEVAYGLAYAHSEDDFKTIQLTILAGSGMLGQHLGKSGATADYVLGLIRANELVEEKYNTLSPEYLKLAAGYVAGLNAYATAHPEEIFIKKAFPVTLKRYLAGSVLSLSLICGLDKALKNIFDGKVETLEKMQIGGSNAIAIHSSKSTDGAAYFAINSHQPLEGPTAWYEAHICSEEGLNALGGLFPGGPVIFVGVNENLSWGHTVNGQDKIDVFQLKMNPKNKNQYEFDGQWLELESRKIKMKVKAGAFTIPVSRTAYWSKYGATLKTDKGFFSVRFGANMDIRGVDQWYHMNKSRNFSQFYKAMEMTAIPGFNTFYIDNQDTIFYVSNGKIPFRNKEYNWQGTLPGNTSKTLWTDFHPFKDLPAYLNPSSGYLFNANNTPYNATAAENNLKAENFDPTMGYETFDNNRSGRLTELFNATTGKISYDQFKKIKYDAQYPAKFMFPTNIDSLFMMDETKYPEFKTMLNAIKTWDHNTEIDSKGAGMFSQVYYKIYEKYRNAGFERTITIAEFESFFKEVKTELITNFGKTDITLGEVQKLVRGDKELAVSGMADVLRAMYCVPHTMGKRKGYQGESYISLVKFKKGQMPEIESVINYGASNHPENKHYGDQMEMFVNQKLKPMTLDKTEVLKTAERIYSPK
jgi:acyl-homoserine-lactone acylase